MQTVKKIIIFITCFVVLLSTFSVGSSAVDVEYDPYTGEEMIYDGDSAYYSYAKPLEYEPISTFALSSPNYSDFDISKLPWLEMPSYIQEIMTAKPVGLLNDTSYSGEYKLPFIAVVLNGETAHIIAGYNLCVGSYFQTKEQREDLSPYAVFISSPKYNTPIYRNSVCYHAYYSMASYRITQAWSNVEPVAVGDNVVRYLNLYVSSSGRDYYFYGSNGVYAGVTLQNLRINAEDSDSYPMYTFVNDPSSGFSSGRITYASDSWAGYIGTFTPPTPEQMQAETSKGMWDTLKSVLSYIKNLPTNIADSIKGFFTSLGDRLSGFFDSLKTKITGLLQNSEGKSFFTVLGDRISEFFNSLKTKLTNLLQNQEGKSFFTVLGDRIKGFFDNLRDKFNEFITGLGDRISGFFTTLTENVSSYFTTLRNYLLYFQATKPEHVNPFANLLTNIQNFFNEQNSNLKEFKEDYLDAHSSNDTFSFLFSDFDVVFSIITSNYVLRLSLICIIIIFVARKVIGR